MTVTKAHNQTNLGGQVTTREVTWLEMSQNAWGSEFHAPDHRIYNFSGGKTFDSTDKGLTGIYGVDVTLPWEAESNYPDMDSTIEVSDPQNNIFTDNKPEPFPFFRPNPGLNSLSELQTNTGEYLFARQGPARGHTPYRWVTRGTQILVPNGNTFVPFGTNSRWKAFKVSDTWYIKTTLGMNCVRIEFHWRENGVAGDSYSASHPELGYIDPDALAELSRQVAAYTAAGLWVGISVHSKCGRSGLDDGAGLGDYCAFPDAYTPTWSSVGGRNFWTDPNFANQHQVLLSFLASYFKEWDNIGWIEPINEPDPTGFSDLDVRNYYIRCVATIRAQDPNMCIMVGGNNGYQAAKMLASHMTGIQNILYTWDSFDQPSTGGGDPVARKANLLNRILQACQMRTLFNVPVIPQQYGSHHGADITRDILSYIVATLLNPPADGVPIGCIHWELNSDTGGGTDGGTTYGIKYPNPSGDGTDIEWPIDKALMQTYSALFNSVVM